MDVEVTLNMSNINAIEKGITQALLSTADAVKTDVQQSQTMPFDTGTMQNESTFVDGSDIGNNKASVVTDTPYARRIYFHPEYNFQKTHNPNAGAQWYDPYLVGTKKDYCVEVFAQFVKGVLGG